MLGRIMCLTVAAASIVFTASAQEIAVKGTIKDKQGKAIENALVRFEKLGYVTVSSAGGGFVLNSTSPVQPRSENRSKVEGVTINRGAAYFSVAAKDRIEFAVFTLQGRRCLHRSLSDLLPGTYSAPLEALIPATIGSGTYIVSAIIGNHRAAGQIIHRAGNNRPFDVRKIEERSGPIFLARRTDLLDIVTISKLGYVSYSTQIESYQQDLGEIILEESGELAGAAAIAAVEDSLVKLLQERIQSIGEIEGPDELKAIDFISIRNGFEAILAIDSTRVKSNVGYMVSALASLNVNPKIWKIADSLDAYIDAVDNSEPVAPVAGESSRLMKRAMKTGGVLTLGKAMAAKTPALLLASVQKPSFPKFLTVSYLQDLIEADLMPVLASVQRSAGRIEALSDASMTVTVEGDDYEIDKGEIYLVDAYTRLMQAYMYMVCSYDMDLFASPTRQDYSWIDTLVNADSESGNVYTLKGDTLYEIRSWKGEKKMIQTMVGMLNYNLERRASFLTIRRPYHAASFDCFKSIPEKIKSGLAAIKAETDDQENDLLKISMIDSANGEMLDFSGDLRDEGFSASFAENFTSIDKLMDFITTLLSGPYTFDETIDAKTVTITVNLPAWFNNPVTDLRTLLPNYTWTNEAEWTRLDTSTWESVYWNKSFACRETLVTFDGSSQSYPIQICDDTLYYILIYESEDAVVNIDASVIDSVATTSWGEKRYYINHPVTYRVSIDSSYYFDALRLTDESGKVIENETIDELVNNKMFFPYFKDYTFHGLFPDMTRAKWLDLIWTE